MKVAIIEDEIPARQQLISLLQKVRAIEVVFEAASIKEAVSCFKEAKSLDLIFMDIQLNDGLSLEIFDRVDIKVPVIFATAFDHYTLQAFQQNGIDYLLKPIKKNDLEEALKKYEKLQQHFSKDFRQLLIRLTEEKPNIRKRILVKRGTHFSSVSMEDVRYFFSEHKITFLVDHQGQKAIVDESLSELESTLEPSNFFRVNRKYLSALSGIEKFTSDGKGRLILNLLPAVEEQVIVSQEKAGEFKSWIVGR